MEIEGMKTFRVSRYSKSDFFIVRTHGNEYELRKDVHVEIK